MVFQVINRTIWARNKAHKSGISLDARCLRCEDEGTMEHLLYSCENFSAKIWKLVVRSMTLAISRHNGDYIPNIVLTLYEIVFNKPHPSILLNIKDAIIWKV